MADDLDRLAERISAGTAVVTAGEPVVGLMCDRCRFETAWTGTIYWLDGDGPRHLEDVSGCIYCDDDA